MGRVRFLLFTTLLMALFAIRAHAAASDIALTPGSLAFTYQIGGTAPASHVTVGNAVPVVVSVGGVSSTGVATMAVK